MRGHAPGQSGLTKYWYVRSSAERYITTDEPCTWRVGSSVNSGKPCVEWEAHFGRKSILETETHE